MPNDTVHYPEYLSLPFCINAQMNHRPNGLLKTILYKTLNEQQLLVRITDNHSIEAIKNKNRDQPSTVFSEFGSQAKRWP